MTDRRDKGYAPGAGSPSARDAAMNDAAGLHARGPYEGGNSLLLGGTVSQGSAAPDGESWARGRMGLLRRLAGAGRSRWSQGGFSPANLFAMLLFAVLAIALFLALMAGTSVYQRIFGDDQSTADLRRGTSLIANTLRAVDAPSTVTSADGPEGPALVLVEHLATGTFETRLYLHEGWIVQEYAVEGAEYNPDAATPVVESATFSFSIQPEAVRVSCDSGQMTVALRSTDPLMEGGGQHA